MPEVRLSLYFNSETKGEQTVQVKSDELNSLLQHVEENSAILSEPETETTIPKEITRHLAQGEG